MRDKCVSRQPDTRGREPKGGAGGGPPTTPPISSNSAHTSELRHLESGFFSSGVGGNGPPQGERQWLFDVEDEPATELWAS